MFNAPGPDGVLALGAVTPEPARAASLVPVQDGWRIRRVEGHGSAGLVPERARHLAQFLTWTPTVAVVGAAAFALLRIEFKVVWWWWLLANGGVVKIGLLAGLGAMVRRLSLRFVGWQMRRLAGVYRTAAALRLLPEGSLVRVRGTVRAAQPFRSAITGEPAVLAHYEVHPEKGKTLHELRGIDFLLDVDGSDPVRIAVADAFFDERTTAEQDITPYNPRVVGTPLGGRVHYREAHIAPGDRVEAIGAIYREVDPEVSAGPGRSPPLRTVLRAGGKFPVLLRRRNR